MIGPRHAIAPRKTERQYELATFGVELYCNGKLSQRGSGALVLGSPLTAATPFDRTAGKRFSFARCWRNYFDRNVDARAMPVSARETWSAKVTGIPLEEIALCFE